MRNESDRWEPEDLSEGAAPTDHGMPGRFE